MPLRICLFLAFVSFSVGEEELIHRCLPTDAECLKRQPLTFMSKTYAGYPSLGIDPIDPLIVTSTDVILDNDTGLVLHFKNINITGFKHSKLDYSFEPTTKLGPQIMEAGITIFSDVEFVFTNSSKTFIGTYYAKSTVRGKSNYATSATDIDGKKYFVMGPETTSCEILGEPTVTLGSELQRALDQDKDGIKYFVLGPDTTSGEDQEDLRDPIVTIGTELNRALDQDEDAAKLKLQWEANITTLRNKVLCGIADNGFTEFLKSLRALTKAYDIHQFFIETPNHRV